MRKERRRRELSLDLHRHKESRDIRYAVCVVPVAGAVFVARFFSCSSATTVAQYVTGAMMNVIDFTATDLSGAFNTNLGSASGIQAFAGPRDDSFFLDLEAAFCILPDRRPSTGALSQPCALPGGAAFRNPGVNYIEGFNVLSVVVELPSSMLENGAPGKLNIWGTISR